MADQIEDTPVYYEELYDLEREFEDVEVEIIRQQYILSKPLYAKRAELVAKIPKFWALVLEQAPVEIDEYIQPTDANVLYSHLTNLTVSRFSLEEDEKKGDPRNFLVRFEFSENEYFEDRVIEKKFWWRHSKDGFEGLVSEPVTIKWKEGKDLTEGLLDLAKAVYDEQLAAPKEAKKGKQTELTEKQKTLKKKISETGMGGVSFFCFFGYVGEIVSEEESKEVIAKENERRKKRQAGEKVKDEDEDMEDEEDLDDDEEDDELDIFPPGDVVAVTIADELWPNAIKYFTQAQDQDLDDVDFEDFEEDDEEEENSGNARPPKKHKRCASGCKH